MIRPVDHFAGAAVGAGAEAAGEALVGVTSALTAGVAGAGTGSARGARAAQPVRYSAAARAKAAMIIAVAPLTAARFAGMVWDGCGAGMSPPFHTPPRPAESQARERLRSR